MIRFLQTDNRMTKALLVVIIGAASVSMVVYLIPGLTGGGAVAGNTYAVIYPHWYSKLLSSGVDVTQEQVEKAARQQLAQQILPAAHCTATRDFAVTMPVEKSSLTINRSIDTLLTHGRNLRDEKRIRDEIPICILRDHGGHGSRSGAIQVLLPI